MFILEDKEKNNTEVFGSYKFFCARVFVRARPEVAIAIVT